MVLSKCFLCGAPGEGDGNGEGGFNEDESLAVVFADKAARRNLPSAEFAMGYYTKVGVEGGRMVGKVPAASSEPRR